MRSHVRTIVVLAIAVGLVALFLHNVDLWRVAGDIARARPMWLVVSLSSMVGNLAIRALRWQYLLEPPGPDHPVRYKRKPALRHVRPPRSPIVLDSDG